MADGIVIPLDADDTKARAKVQRLKREAGQAGAEFGRASSQAARIGGAGGGLAARGLAGFGQGTAAGFVGLGIAAAGAGLNAFLARDAERVSNARAREERNQSREGIARTVMERTDARAAGGVKFANPARALLARGVTQDKQRESLAFGTKLGLTTEQSLASLEVSLRTGVSEGEIQSGLSSGLMGGSAEEVATNIRKFNGLNNAVAALQNVSPEMGGTMIARSVFSTGAENISRATAGMNPVGESQLSSLQSGASADAIARQARDEMNPGEKLTADMARKADETVRALKAAADAQSGLAILLTEMGRVVGVSAGGAFRQVEVGAAAASE